MTFLIDLHLVLTIALVVVAAVAALNDVFDAPLDP
jgi:hypothetical protein